MGWGIVIAFLGLKVSALSFAVILHVVARGFIQPETMQASIAGYGRDVSVEDVPDLYHQGFAAGQLALHKRNIEVEVLVVELVYYLAADERAQFFEVYHKTGFGIGFSFYGYDKVEIMAVPVLIGAGTEYFGILFGAPGRIIQFMGGVEMFFATDVDHGCKYNQDLGGF